MCPALVRVERALPACSEGRVVLERNVVGWSHREAPEKTNGHALRAAMRFQHMFAWHVSSENLEQVHLSRPHPMELATLVPATVVTCSDGVLLQDGE